MYDISSHYCFWVLYYYLWVPLSVVDGVLGRMTCSSVADVIITVVVSTVGGAESSVESYN